MSAKLYHPSIVNLLFVVSLFVFSILIYQTFKSSKEVAKGRELEEQTYKILLQLDQLLSHMLDIEKSTAEFALSGGQKYLPPIQEKITAVDFVLDSLRNLTIDTEQNLRLDTLNVLVSNKIEAVQEIVSMRQKNERTNEIDYNGQVHDSQIMDSIRAVLSRSANKAVILLSKRSEQTDKKRYVRGLYFIILSITALFILTVAYVLMRNNIKALMQNKKLREDLIEELSYQNSQLADFAHLTSHNIRGPANNVAALVSMLNENSPLSEYRLIFSKIEKVSKNLVETLNELLEILHVKNNKDLKKIRLEFQEVCKKETENLEAEILKSSAYIECDFKAAPFVVYPKAYLESIFHNLLSNALKYRSMDRNPYIQLKTEAKNGKVLLTVRDNGLGIDLSRFGDKLFQLRKTFHEHPDARGVGLFMTKEQVEALGGEILVQSKVGAGTTFTVIF